MEVLHRRCAGLDVHKKTVVACIRIAEGGKVQREVREFGTATRALYALAEWLTECGCSHAAMESTGVYWKPVWHVLEVSWAGLCPRLDEGAGKARSPRTRHGHWLKTTLVQAAWAAVRKKDNYLHAQFLRIKRRRGAKRAIIAVAASMLSAAYHMIRDDADYQDLGGDYFLRYDREQVARRLVRRLRELGLEVEVRQAA